MLPPPTAYREEVIARRKPAKVDGSIDVAGFDESRRGAPVKILVGNHLFAQYIANF